MLDNLTAVNIEAVSKSDTTIINPPFKYLLILGAGALAIQNHEGANVTVTFPTGSYPFLLPGRVRRIYDTGTTLTNSQIFGIR